MATHAAVHAGRGIVTRSRRMLAASVHQHVRTGEHHVHNAPLKLLCPFGGAATTTQILVHIKSKGPHNKGTTTRTTKLPTIPDVLTFRVEYTDAGGVAQEGSLTNALGWDDADCDAVAKELAASRDLAAKQTKRKGAPDSDKGAPPILAPTDTAHAKRGTRKTAKQPPAPAPAKPPPPPAKHPKRRLLTDVRDMVTIVKTTWESTGRVANARVVGGCGATDASKAFVTVTTLSGATLEIDIATLSAFVRKCEFARLVWSTSTQSPDSAEAVASISALTHVPASTIRQWKLQGCLQYDTCRKCDSRETKACSCVARGFLAQQKSNSAADEDVLGMDER